MSAAHAQEMEVLRKEHESAKCDLECFYERKYKDKVNMLMQQAYGDARVDVQLRYESQVDQLSRELKLLRDENDRLARKLRLRDKENERMHSSISNDKFQPSKFTASYEKTPTEPRAPSHQPAEVDDTSRKQLFLTREIKQLTDRLEQLKSKSP